MSRTFTSLFAAAALFASIPAASAGPVTQTSSVAVSYADLDLTRAEGAKAMSGRIERAADRVCGTPVKAPLVLRRSIMACRKQAIATAVASIDAPLLTALYEGSEGTRFAGL
jgi:UrcA family protein